MSSSPVLTADISDHGLDRTWLRQAKPGNGTFPYIENHEVDSETLTNIDSSNKTPWRPGIFVRFPYLGILALIGVLLCTIGSVIVLRSSDGQDVELWGSNIAPSVYLAVMSLLANALLGFALAEGLVLSFWRTALSGSTLSELHFNWICGHSLKDAIENGFRKGGKVTALATIFTILSAARGPLNQLASSVRSNVEFPTQGTMELRLAQILPEEYTGLGLKSRGSLDGETERPTAVFSEILQRYTTRSNMTLGYDRSCGTECFATVKGFGFRPNCSVTIFVFEEHDARTVYRSYFNVSAKLYEAEPRGNGGEGFYAGLLLNTTFRSDHETETWRQYGYANGIPNVTLEYTMTSHECRLTGGIVNYNIKLRDGTISFASEDWKDDEFVEEVKLKSPSRSGTDSTIGGFQFAANFLFASGVQYYRSANAAFGEYAPLEGMLSSQFLVNASAPSDNLTWNDPMDYMLNTLRELSFRTALRAGSDNASYTKAIQAVPYTGVNSHTIYRTNTGYMIVALLVSLSGVVAVSVTYYGWWQLGRSVSMSPFEIAKAFDAPMFKNMSGNISSTRWPKQFVEDKTVMYGEDERGHLVVGDSKDVTSPRAGTLY